MKSFYYEGQNSRHEKTWTLAAVKDVISVVFYVVMVVSVIIAVILYFGELGYKLDGLSEDVKEIKETLKSIEETLRNIQDAQPDKGA